MSENRKSIQTVAWKRPDDDSYDHLTDHLVNGECQLTRHPVTDGVASAYVELELQPDADDLKKEIEDLCSGIERSHVKLKLSVEGLDDPISDVPARTTVTGRDNTLAFKISRDAKDKLEPVLSQS